MIPEGPVKESDESNVTLFCNILDANPSVLTKVRWYANSTLLKELPDCEETREDLCHIDPSKLLLESIGRGFFYNYSCEGYNAAGWGPRSEDKELLVHYEPGPATLTHFPLIAVKKKSVTFSCSVDDPGYPESNRFRWLRGGRGPLQDIVTKDWTVEPVGLDSRTNYSCYAFNEGGKGVMATVNLEVHAPPFFIKNLPPYTGMLHTSRNANLTCRIECVPRCEISWLKDGVPIEKNDTRYFVKDKYMDASPATGDFESMLSVLHFNMSNWPNNKFDIEGDNANYTCVSTGNTVGPGIKSATYFSIEYAPDNTTVSEEVVYVAENTIPGRVICKSRANPEPTYEWRFNNKTVIRGNALIINTRMKRNDTGRYTCVAYNKHGRSTAETFIDVQFTPRCEIERQEIEDKDTLICTAYGNPEEADFSWSIKGDNETVEWLGNGDHKAFKDKSYYELKEDYAIARTYRCVANNTAGAGTFCEIEVAEQLAWWQRWDTTTLIILVASILVLLLAVIIICCIIICICRRRRRQDKYILQHIINSTTTATTSNNTSTTVTTPPTTITTTLVTTPTLSVRLGGEGAQIPKSPPRWPLRPGVMVHVSSDTKENLAVNRMTLKPTATLANLTANSTVNDSSVSSSTLNNSAATNTTQTTLLNVTRQSSGTMTLGRIGRQARIQQQQQQQQPLHDQQDLQALKVEANEHVSSSKQQLSLCQTLPIRGKQTIATNLTVTTTPHVINLNTTTDALTEETNTLELTRTHHNEEDIVQQEISTNQGNPSNETEVTHLNVKLSNLKKVELFFSNMFFKRSTKTDGCRDSQRSHVGLLGGKFWKRSEAASSQQSSKSPFSTEHRLKGIRSSGSGLITTTAQAQQQTPVKTTTIQHTPQTTQEQPQQQQHPLPVSVISMSPSLNINHPPQNIAADERHVAAIMPNDRSVTTVIQSIPSTIVSSRVISRNPSQSSIQRKGILKAPTPPPRPPPIMRMAAAPLKRSASQTEKSQKIERVQTVQEKSSSMADPLTEPGEYENLPFHGLQTAPNKFTTPTTPTNFNNNTNVVRSVPRPKRLNGNISQNTGTAATTIQANYYDEHETETQQPHTQQYYQQQQQQQYSTMPYNRHPATTSASATLPGMQTLIPNSTAANIVRNDAGIIVHNGSNNNTTAATTNTNPHQMTYNLNNCFPKSYTEYYQQQQQQQQQHPHSQQLQQPPQQFSQKFNNAGGIAGASSHLINAIEHDFNTYAVVERQQPPQQSNATKSTNPFLAVSNFKKFDTSGDEDLQAGNYQTASMKRQGKRKTFADKLEDKRFYSLKFTGNSNKQKQQQQQQSNKSSTAAAALNINHSFNGSTSAGLTGGGVFGSLLSSANKCKRHHSFAGGSLGDIDPKGPVRNPHMNFYDPPAYENVNDAVQVHNAAVSDMELPEGLNGSAQTATVLLHPLPYGIAGGSQGPKKKHHQRQHQPKEDLNLIEPERLSIYRSDSGISNSSYECVTPLPSSTQTPGSTPPPGKMPRTPKTPKTPKGHKNQTLAHTAVTAHFNSSHKKPAPRVPPTPLYMNVNDQQPPQQLNSNNISNLERPSSPSSTMATSAYESASSSQNDNTCNDPISLSSTTSLYSGGGGNNKSSLSAINQRCNRHQQPPEISTPEEFEQYQLGHHAHAHSSSSLSVASSVSASGSNAGGRVKCKKQQQQQQRLNGQGALINHMELNKRKSLANNPFLATNPAAATATTCHKKLHRRQTISDPYAHIKHINECRRQSNNTNINNSSSHSSNNNKTHNYCAKSANAFKAATTTTTASDTQSSAPAAATACSPYKSQQQQQTGLQQYNKNQQSTSSLSYSSACNATAATTTSSRQQFATHHQQQMLMHKNAVHNNNNNNNCKIASDDKKRIHNEVIIHVADNEYNVNAVAAKATHDYQDKGEQTFSQPHRSLNCDVVDSVEKKKSYVNQVVRTGHNRSLSNTTKLYTTLEDNANTTTTPSQIEGFMERPVKLPLRKYHSFHFQPTQTVAGQDICKLQQLRLQQQQQHQQSSLESQYSSPDISSTQPYAKQGPLVFRPYKLDENVSFKPIQPSEESEDSIDYVREYVGTVEMFLKDEEKYMDSGDFTNLTQRLKRQEDFLNDPYSSQTSEVEEASSISLREFNADSQTNSLYEDIHFRPPTLAQTNKVTLETVKPSREDLGKGQHFINSPRALNLLKTVIETDSSTTKNEPAEKSSQFIHSPRALNLLKTVIETDAYQSDAEEDQVCQTTAKKVATPRHLEHVSNPHSPKVSSLSRTNQDTSPAKVEPDYSVARCVRRESSSKVSTIRNYSQDSIDSGINSQVYRTSSNTCVRNDSVKSSGSSNVSNYSKTLQNSLDCESNVSANSNTTQHSSMTQSLQDSKNIREYFQNSPKVSTTSKTFDNSENYTFFMDENRNAQSQMISRESTNSPKVSLSSKISGNSGTYALVMDENRNPQTSIDSPQTTNSPKVSTLNRTSQLSEHRKTDLNANRNQQKNTNPQDLHNSTKALSKTRFTQDHKTLSQEAQAYKLSTLSSQTDTTNSPKRSTSFLARKSLVFASSSNKLKDQAEISQLPLEESILTEQDLAKVFKPYKEPKDSNPLDSKRPVSTALNPAASLEALEMLTKSNPDLWTSNQAGSRHNLHQLELFHTLQQQNKKQLSKNSAAQENDEEDLGYSFCEDENDDEEDLEEKQATVSPHVNVIMAANSQTASQVKYVLTQNHGEVHI
ncbi:uncharacterized protein LOC119612879 isoform X5 [Lucilia sericata]|uniref:uncharacterized protein LOC119612879 isoform X5 n=1 Tax=Lucilia sericata TaxID=13632 RepID=UPI0018A7FBDB|nr:uncharacterized protein LOC119612879 isoform X5 [Lucilia sericata]